MEKKKRERNRNKSECFSERLGDYRTLDMDLVGTKDLDLEISEDYY